MIASMVAALVRTIGLSMAMGPMGFAMGVGSVFGVVIDLILLIVILVHRREWPHTLVQA